MTRITRNIPADCCCDSWKKGIRTINGQYPDDNREFNLAAGDGIEITPITAGVEISVKAPLPGPMIFRGTVGTGGTITTLPDANVDNIGWTYVAITAGTTPDDTPQSYDIGDTLVSNGSEWTVIPSGDDPVDWSQIQNKPTTVAGYGITDAVDTTSNQDVRGYKTFLNDAYSSVNIKSGRTAGTIGGVAFYNGNGLQINNIHSSNSGIVTVDLLEGTQKALEVVNQRAYDSGNVDDIVTIGSLASNPNVVHTTGNETIAGQKSFSNNIILQTGCTISYGTSGTRKETVLSAANGSNTAYLALRCYDGGGVALVLLKFDGVNYTSSTIATLS